MIDAQKTHDELIHGSTRRRLIFVFFALAWCASPAFTAPARNPEITRETFTSQNRRRTFHLFAPPGIVSSERLPLVILLHGANGDGRGMVESWRTVAAQEHIVLAAPHAHNRERWATPHDSPDLLRDLIEHLKTRHTINARRVYLFGYSAGAGFAINMSLIESEYFAATAVFASATLRPNYIDRAQRKIPFLIFGGTRDEIFPIAEVRATRDLLVARGFNAQLIEIPNHGHNYFSRANDVIRRAWEFLSQHELDGDPQFQQYQFTQSGSR